MDSVFLPSPPSQDPVSTIRDEELLKSLPKFALLPSSLPDLPPLVDPSWEKILSDLSPKEKLERYHQDLAVDEYLYGPTITEETQVIEHDNLVSLENILDDSQKKPKEKRKRSKVSPKKNNKKLKTESVESRRTSGIFVGYCEKLPEMKVAEKKEEKVRCEE